MNAAKTMTIAMHWEALDADGRVILTADTCLQLIAGLRRIGVEDYSGVDYVNTLGAKKVGEKY